MANVAAMLACLRSLPVANLDDCLAALTAFHEQLLKIRLLRDSSPPASPPHDSSVTHRGWALNSPKSFSEFPHEPKASVKTWI